MSLRGTTDPLEVAVVLGPLGAVHGEPLRPLLEVLAPRVRLAEYGIGATSDRVGRRGRARLPWTMLPEERVSEIAARLALLAGGEFAGVVLHGGLTRSQLEALDGPRKSHLADGRLPYLLIGIESLVPHQRAKQSAETFTAFESDRIEVARRGLGTGHGPILLEGETGTGKTRLASVLHSEVFARAGPLLNLNCASLDRERFDSYFRGVEDGVYTNVKAKDSVFVDVSTGTVLLDEFQDLGLSQQAMLLDLLDPFSTRVSGHRVGNNTARWFADVQVIVALNRPVAELLSQKTLRPDLFHRLWRRLRLPPLREYIGPVHLRGHRRARAYLRHKLVRMQETGFRAGVPFSSSVNERDFLDAFRRTFSLEEFDEPKRFRPIPRALGPESLAVPDALLAHSWPGNFRELESLAHMLMDSGQLGRWGSESEVANKLDNLTFGLVRSSAQPDSTGDVLLSPAHLLGRAYLAAARDAGGRVTRMASSLNLDARTVRKYLKQWITLGAASPHWAAELACLSEAEQQEFRLTASELVSSEQA